MTSSVKETGAKEAAAGRETTAGRRPAGYYGLTVGTKYIVLDGVAVPIDAIDGDAQGSCFYQNGDAEGHFIRTREATASETHAASKGGAPVARPALAALDLSLWK